MIKYKGGKMKMALQTWIIVILLILSYYQYSNPTKANEMLEPIWGQVKNFINNNNPLPGNTENNNAVTCPDIDEPVCGDDGVSYKNSCEAALEGVLVVTPGAC